MAAPAASVERDKRIEESIVITLSLGTKEPVDDEEASGRTAGLVVVDG